MNPFMEMLFLYVFPSLSIGLLAFIFIFFIFIIPSSAWARIKAKLKRNCVIVVLFNDEGFEKTELMKSDLGQGIFSGNPISYIFTPRPTWSKIKVKVPNRKNKKTIEAIDISEKTQENLNEALTHRMITDTGKPIYYGYIGKSVAVTPRFLDIVKKVNKKANIFKTLELLDPRLLKVYVGKTLSPSLIETIKAENERKGYLRRPVSDTLKKMALPIGLLMIILVVGILLMTGQIDLSGIFDFG